MNIIIGNYKIKFIYLLLLFYTVISLINLGHYSLRVDEADTAILARNMLTNSNLYPHSIYGEERLVDYPYTNQNNIEINNGWLHFYVLLPFFHLFGYSEFIARFPFVIFGILTIWLTYLLGKILFNEKTGIFAAILLSGSFYFFLFIRQTRYYSLVSFFALSAIYFYWNFIAGKRYSAILLFFSLLFLSQTYYLAFASTIVCFFIHFIITHHPSAENKLKYFKFITTLFTVALIFYLFAYFVELTNSVFFTHHSLSWSVFSIFYYILQLSLFDYSPLFLIFLGLPLLGKINTKALKISTAINLIFFIYFISKLIIPSNSSISISITILFLLAFFICTMCIYSFKENKSIFFLLIFYILSIFTISIASPINFNNFRYVFHLLPISALIVAHFIAIINTKNLIKFCMLFLIAFTNIIPILTFSFFILTFNENLFVQQPKLKLAEMPIIHFLSPRISPIKMFQEITSKDLDAGKAMSNYFKDKDIKNKRIFLADSVKLFNRGLKFNLWNTVIIDDSFTVGDDFDCSKDYDIIISKNNSARINYNLNPLTTPQNIINKLTDCLSNSSQKTYKLIDRINFTSWYDNLMPNPDIYNSVPDKEDRLYVFELQ